MGYSQVKFTGLSLKRKTQVVLDLIHKLEQSWESPREKDLSLKLLRDYFQWFDLHGQSDPLLKRLAPFEFQINETLSLRTLLDLAVPLERFLSLSIKDEHIIPVEEGDKLESLRKTFPLFYVLDHLRSAFNVGSLFRSAECLGVQHIYLLGYTPTPSEHHVQKTSMGTWSSVSWSHHNHLQEVVEKLKQQNIPLVALETAKNAVPLNQFTAPSQLALLVGNERFGLSQKSLEFVDSCLSIPMMGNKNSLNVANSLSIASFEVIRQWTP